MLVKIGWTDYKERKIYDRWLLRLLILTLIFRGVYYEKELLLGSIIVSLPMFLLAIFIPGCFGGGDIKLMAVAGLLLGWKNVICAFVFAVYIAGVYVVVMLIRKKITKKTKIPFGPALCTGIIYMFFSSS